MKPLPTHRPVTVRDLMPPRASDHLTLPQMVHAIVEREVNRAVRKAEAKRAVTNQLEDRIAALERKAGKR